MLSQAIFRIGKTSVRFEVRLRNLTSDLDPSHRDFPKCGTIDPRDQLSMREYSGVTEIKLLLDWEMMHRYIVDWFVEIADRNGTTFSQFSTPVSGELLIAGEGGLSVISKWLGKDPFCTFTSSDKGMQERISIWGAEAVQLTRSGDYGELRWYVLECRFHGFDHQVLSSGGLGSALSRLPIPEWARLGPLLFNSIVPRPKETHSNQFLAFEGERKLSIYIPVVEPRKFARVADRMAVENCEWAAAACTAATNRGIKLGFRPVPAAKELQSQLTDRLADGTIETWAISGISLSIAPWRFVPGGNSCFERVQAALLTFDAAIKQERDSVACMLYVAAAESLAVINQPWRKNQVVSRFLSFFELLMPDHLNELIEHANYEMAFGLKRGNKKPVQRRRDLLEKLYDFRSTIVHSGTEPAYRGLVGSASPGEMMFRTLCMEFARYAIAAYIRSPFSSLVGRPDERAQALE